MLCAVSIPPFQAVPGSFNSTPALDSRPSNVVCDTQDPPRTIIPSKVDKVDHVGCREGSSALTSTDIAVVNAAVLYLGRKVAAVLQSPVYYCCEIVDVLS